MRRGGCLLSILVLALVPHLAAHQAVFAPGAALAELGSTAMQSGWKGVHVNNSAQDNDVEDVNDPEGAENPVVDSADLLKHNETVGRGGKTVTSVTKVVETTEQVPAAGRTDAEQEDETDKDKPVVVAEGASDEDPGVIVSVTTKKTTTTTTTVTKEVEEGSTASPTPAPTEEPAEEVVIDVTTEAPTPSPTVTIRATQGEINDEVDWNCVQAAELVLKECKCLPPAVYGLRVAGVSFLSMLTVYAEGIRHFRSDWKEAFEHFSSNAPLDDYDITTLKLKMKQRGEGFADEGPLPADVHELKRWTLMQDREAIRKRRAMEGAEISSSSSSARAQVHARRHRLQSSQHGSATDKRDSALLSSFMGRHGRHHHELRLNPMHDPYVSPLRRKFEAGLSPPLAYEKPGLKIHTGNDPWGLAWQDQPPKPQAGGQLATEFEIEDYARTFAYWRDRHLSAYNRLLQATGPYQASAEALHTSLLRTALEVERQMNNSMDFFPGDKEEYFNRAMAAVDANAVRADAKLDRASRRGLWAQDPAVHDQMKVDLQNSSTFHVLYMNARDKVEQCSTELKRRLPYFLASEQARDMAEEHLNEKIRGGDTAELRRYNIRYEDYAKDIVSKLNDVVTATSTSARQAVRCLEEGKKELSVEFRSYRNLLAQIATNTKSTKDRWSQSLARLGEAWKAMPMGQYEFLLGGAMGGATEAALLQEKVKKTRSLLKQLREQSRRPIGDRPKLNYFWSDPRLEYERIGLLPPEQHFLNLYYDQHTELREKHFMAYLDFFRTMAPYRVAVDAFLSVLDTYAVEVKHNLRNLLNTSLYEAGFDLTIRTAQNVTRKAEDLGVTLNASSGAVSPNGVVEVPVRSRLVVAPPSLLMTGDSAKQGAASKRKETTAAAAKRHVNSILYRERYERARANFVACNNRAELGIIQFRNAWAAAMELTNTSRICTTELLAGYGENGEKDLKGLETVTVADDSAHRHAVDTTFTAPSNEIFSRASKDGNTWEASKDDLNDIAFVSGVNRPEGINGFGGPDATKAREMEADTMGELNRQ